MKWWRRFVDYYRTLRTRGTIADRECRHDGTEPMCSGCLRDLSGW